MEHIIIIGAGAAGLMAGKLLSGLDYKVSILEAGERIGGRIHTLLDPAFRNPVELGAEFIHGDLELTQQLLQEADIPYHLIDGEMWHSQHGRFHQDDQYAEHWPLLISRLEALEEDCSILEFMEREFPGEAYATMRQSVIRFAQGYDAADAGKISALSLKAEWTSTEEHQYRIEGGYGRLVSFLEEYCTQRGAAFLLNTEVTHIEWEPGKAVVQSKDGRMFDASRVIITAPLALLQQGAITVTPGIPEHETALQRIGAGQVIKFILQFREDFWNGLNIAQLEDLQMLLSDEDIPTWWTQFPEKLPMLTGWLGGPKAASFSSLSKDALLDKALQSLSALTHQEPEMLKRALEGWQVANWPQDPLFGYAYSYAVPGTPAARALLSTPVEDTLYFAGEAMYGGASTGTVEAALQSAQQVVAQITGSVRPEE